MDARPPSTNQLPHPSVRLPAIRITARLVLLVAVSMIVVAGTVTAMTVNVIRAEMTRTAIEAQEVKLKVAWEILRQKGDTFEVRDGALYAGSFRINDNFEVVDKVRDVMGGLATIFQGDLRISTNGPNADGTGRGVGTRLARGPVYDFLTINADE